MPFEKSGSSAAEKSNFDEFRHGPTFAKTEKKFGSKKAHKQMIAAVLSNKRRYGKSAKKSSGKKTKRG